MAIQYSDFVFYTGTDNPVVGAFVTVYNFGTTTLSTLVDSTAQPLDNPVLTDSNGYFEFYAASGHYDIWMYGTRQYSIALNAATGGIEEAPIDGNQYARQDAAWSIVTTGAGAWDDLTGTATTVPFNTTPAAIPTTTGSTYWNSVDGTLDTVLASGVTLQHGQETHFYGRASGAISNGDLCQFDGVQGDHVKFKKAVSADVIAYPQYLMGVATHNMLNGEFGYVTSFGKINGVYTETPANGDSANWVAGDLLYFDNTTGGLTKVEPNAPEIRIVVAAVIKVQSGAAENGIILVRPTYGMKLQNLDDVNGTPLTADGQMMVWDQTSQYFDATKNINDYVPLSVLTDMKDPSGFLDPSNITMTYDTATRKVTLAAISGTVDYYWRGVKKTLGASWTSPTAHTAANGKYWLYSTDGTTFAWSADSASAPWAWYDIQVAIAIEDSTRSLQIAVRECHSVWDWQSHRADHLNIGTYHLSGGAPTVGTYTENSGTDADKTMGFDAAVIQDEDLPTTVTAWAQGTYTTARISSADPTKIAFDTAATFPFRSSGGYILINNPTTGVETEPSVGKFLNVYQILVPTTSDTGSQLYRTVMLQPQVAHNTLALAKAEDTRNLALGDILTALGAEICFYTRVTYETIAAGGNTGKCKIATGGISFVVGSRVNQVSVSSTGTGMVNPMTTAGDIIIGDTAGVPLRLPIGTAAQQLRVNVGATAPEWATDIDFKVSLPCGAFNLIGATTEPLFSVTDATNFDYPVLQFIDGSDLNVYFQLPSRVTSGYAGGNINVDIDFLLVGTTLTDGHTIKFGVGIVEVNDATAINIAPPTETGATDGTVTGYAKVAYTLGASETTLFKHTITATITADASITAGQMWIGRLHRRTGLDTSVAAAYVTAITVYE